MAYANITPRDFGISYEIMQITPLEYKIFKYKHSFQEQEYTVAHKQNKGFNCSCIAGHTHGACKHLNWCKLIREGNADMLPGHVKLHASIDISVAKRQVMKALTRLANTKIKVKREKSIEK